MQRRFGVAATKSVLGSLEPLLQCRPGALVATLPAENGCALGRWKEILEEVDALMVVGPREIAPRSALPGPLIRDRCGRPVVVSWLPDMGPEGLARFARTVARVEARAGGVGPVALLSQWERRALFLVRRMERSLAHRSIVPVVRWSGERIRRETLLAGLGAGPGLTLYVGHGRSVGWAGYSGLRTRHLERIDGEPSGFVVSASCDTASRQNVGLSFTEAWVTRGRAVAALGAVERTQHLHNRRWMRLLCASLIEGGSTVDEVVRAAFSDRPESAVSYRLIGDPIAALRGAPGAWPLMRAVDAPCPSDGALVEREAIRSPRIHRATARIAST